ncbi:MAG: NmrA family NAD(P)-binding protein [Propionibacteriaceae bacterium]
MHITVTTPTGHVGSHVVRLLLQAGVRPTLLVRDPSKLGAETVEASDVRQGNLDDPDFVTEASRGADALFWVDPTDFMADDPNALSRRLGSHAASAVVANRIARVVFQSSVGAEKRTGAGLIDGLASIEQQLDATGADVTHLRCGYFFTNLLDTADSLREGKLQTTMAADAPMPWVDPRDIATVVVGRLLSPDWSGRVVQGVHGPADLSFTEVAEILTEVLGRSIALDVVSDDEQRAGLLAVGMSETAAAGVVGMTSGLREGFVPEQPRSALTTTPTTLAEWATVQLRPLVVSP